MWRELARRNVPWQQWTVMLKEAAHENYQSALRRQRNDAERMRFWDEDNELFKLLQPYKSDLRDFYAKHTITLIYGSATNVGRNLPPRYEAPSGERSKWTADVNLLDDKHTAATGVVLFEISNPSGISHTAERVTLASGRAVYTTVPLVKGKYWVKAIYMPLNTGNISSACKSGNCRI